MAGVTAGETTGYRLPEMFHEIFLGFSWKFPGFSWQVVQFKFSMKHLRKKQKNTSFLRVAPINLRSRTTRTLLVGDPIGVPEVDLPGNCRIHFNGGTSPICLTCFRAKLAKFSGGYIALKYGQTYGTVAYSSSIEMDPGIPIELIYLDV